MNPDVSVVLITWCVESSRLKRLRQTLASMREHTVRPHWLVVVDNGDARQRPVIEAYDPDIWIANDPNRGVGISRNQGAAATDSRYIAFVDNDIGYFPGWLDRCIESLKQYSGRKLIATAVKTKPMRLAVSELGEYRLYRRCAGMAMVMRRDSFDELGGFDEHRTNVGHQWCRVMREKHYLFVYHESWSGQHLCGRSSYHYKKQIFNPSDGSWIWKSELQESAI